MQEVLLYNAVSDSWIQIRVNGKNHLSMRVSPNIEDWVRVMWIQYMNANVPIDEVVASLITRGFRIEKGLTKDALNHIVSYLTMQETHTLWKESKSAIYKTTLLRALDYSVWKRWFEQDFWVPQGTLFETLGPEEAYRMAYDAQMIALHLIITILNGEFFEEDENKIMMFHYSIIDFKTILFEHKPIFSQRISIDNLYNHLKIGHGNLADNVPPIVLIITFCEHNLVTSTKFLNENFILLLSSINKDELPNEAEDCIMSFLSNLDNQKIIGRKNYKKEYTLFC